MTQPRAITDRRLAILGAGSSGLISLKYALDLLPGWSIKCFEATDKITGAWGNPYRGFVSTSTKYTTQFSCYPKFDATVVPDGGATRSEFFCDGEYGEYLTRFAEEFNLRQHIAHGHRVTSVRRSSDQAGWTVTYQAAPQTNHRSEHFDAVIICTGLVAEPKSLGRCDNAVDLKQLASDESLRQLSGQRIVVVGGGEMAADLANRLADPTLSNRVFLSLRSGIRVSPRYHPIRGVPSDFLRNRLMLSIHPDLRNKIGQAFVAARIRYQDWFEWFFPPNKRSSKSAASETEARRKDWAERLNRRAPYALFDMFHNKSDDFLQAIAEERIKVIGPPVDSDFVSFASFDGKATQTIDPDVVVPAIGYRSRLGELLGEETSVRDFYLGCCHTTEDNLFAVGFARPVIGNIPSISEIQALYVVRQLAGLVTRPPDREDRHQFDLAINAQRFSCIDNRLIYPVEMFPYCDRLAEEMEVSIRATTIADWWTQLTAPATTLDYPCFQSDPNHGTERSRPPTYLPMMLIAFLFALKPIDWCYRLLKR